MVREKGRKEERKVSYYCSAGIKQLVAAIKDGDLDGVKRIVRDKNLIHSINTVTDYRRYNMTPLHHACE